MGIFGHRGCDVDRDDEVSIQRKHGDCEFNVAEQLSTKKAKECYDELKRLVSDKNSFIEITDTHKRLWLIPKDEIGRIVWYKNNKD